MTAAEFDDFTNKLKEEIPAACIDYKMYRDLHDACFEDPVVVAQSKAFWTMTLEAHLNSAVLRLCRIYDAQKSSLNLAKWLKAIRGNPQWFSEQSYEKRRPGSKYPGDLDAKQLEKDIVFASDANPLVKNLIKFRGSLVAHIGENYVLNRHKARESFKLTIGNLKSLATGASTILDRYMHHYERGQYSTKLVGADDFEFIFVAIKEAIAHREKQWSASKTT